MKTVKTEDSDNSEKSEVQSAVSIILFSGRHGASVIYP